MYITIEMGGWVFIQNIKNCQKQRESDHRKKCVGIIDLRPTHHSDEKKEKKYRKPPKVDTDTNTER